MRLIRDKQVIFGSEPVPFISWDGRLRAASSLVYDEPASPSGPAAAVSPPALAAAPVRERPAVVDRCLDELPQAEVPPAVTPEQLGRWLDEHGPTLALFARQWCRSADDVVQEAFVQLARQAAGPRTLRRGCIAWFAMERFRPREPRGGGVIMRRWLPRRRAGGFCRRAMLSLDGEAAAQALARLPLEEREIIVAHLWGGLTFAEIGEVIGISSSTAHRRYESGLIQLREWLK